MRDETTMGPVRIRHAAEDARLSGVFALMLEQHGLQSELLPSDAPAAGEAPAPTLIAFSSGARSSASFQSCCRALRDRGDQLYVLRFDDVLASDLPDGLEKAPVFEFTADGLRALLEELGAPHTDVAQVGQLVGAAGAGIPDWSLQRFRYGLWLAFSRATGAGKFDPYPLTHSKRIGTQEALLAEVSLYGYRDPSSGSPVAPESALCSALDRVWDEPENMIPNAIHVVEAAAEHLWNQYRPHSLNQLRTA